MASRIVPKWAPSCWIGKNTPIQIHLKASKSIIIHQQKSLSEFWHATPTRPGWNLRPPLFWGDVGGTVFPGSRSIRSFRPILAANAQSARGAPLFGPSPRVHRNSWDADSSVTTGVFVILCALAHNKLYIAFISHIFYTWYIIVVIPWWRKFQK